MEFPAARKTGAGLRAVYRGAGFGGRSQIANRAAGMIALGMRLSARGFIKNVRVIKHRAWIRRGGFDYSSEKAYSK